MEIDPHRIDDASDTTINSLELWLAAQKLFKCIVDSEKIIPTQIKQLMRHIDSEVGAKYDAQAQFRSMGGFLFLRMLCPALMAPQVYGLLDSPPHPVSLPPHSSFFALRSSFFGWVADRSYNCRWPSDS
jgi:neurofibromin 1